MCIPLASQYHLKIIFMNIWNELEYLFKSPMAMVSAFYIWTRNPTRDLSKAPSQTDSTVNNWWRTTYEYDKHKKHHKKIVFAFRLQLKRSRSDNREAQRGSDMVRGHRDVCQPHIYFVYLKCVLRNLNQIHMMKTVGISLYEDGWLRLGR